VGRNNNFNFHCGVLVDLQFVCCCGPVKIAPQQQAASSKQQAASSKQQAAATEVQAHHKLLNDHFFRANTSK
jgi:hypothetical protein